MRFKSYFLLILSLGYLQCFGQTSGQLTPADFTKLNNILPPSPTAFELGKYGGINASNISGAVSKQIPLFTYTAGHLSVPIALSYTSNGIKVDQIGTRVGMGWNLEIGGMISRVVYDQPDELGQPLLPPTDLVTPSDSLLNFFLSATNQSGLFDTQPDVYSFNFGGFTGKFIITDGTVRLITHSNIKIEPNIENYSFRVTTSNGDKYYFGGTNATESSRNDNNCNTHSPQYIKNAWFLSKIVAYTGEVINFTYGQGTSTYQAGINQVMMRKIASGCTLCAGLPSQCNDFPDQTCQSYVSNHFVYLTNITSSITGNVKLDYSSRQDVYGEYLLSRIRYFSSTDSSTLLKTYNFNYLKATPGKVNSADQLDVRYFLSAVSEVSGNGSEMHQHTFAYDDVYGLPSRCSYSQDYYGYYNGKTNNRYMIPKLQSLDGFPTDLADRTPDWQFAKKGLLTRIVYPTGGRDSISYESNTIFGNLVTPAPVFNVNISGLGSGTRTGVPVTSSTFTPLLSQYVHITSTCEYRGQDTPDPNILPYLKTRTELLDLTNGQTISIRESTYIGESYLDSTLVTGGHNYALRITPYGGNTYGSAAAYYRNTNPVDTPANLPQAGVRVLRIITADNSGVNPPIVKRIYYGGEGSGYQFSTGLTSSGPEYYMHIKTQDVCQGPTGPGGSQGGNGFSVYNCEYNALYSNSVLTTYLQDSPVQYRQVTESNGENFENGGISHTYLTDQDTPGPVIWGERITSAPLSNFGIMNGLEIQTATLAKNGTQLVKIKTSATHYKTAPSPAFEVKGYVVNKKYNAALIGAGETSLRLAQFDALSYSIFGKWFYADTVTTTTYDKQGLNPVTETVMYSYDNPVHALPTAIKTVTSDGKTSLYRYQYPPDVSSITGLDGGQINILNTLNSLNRIDQSVKVVKTLNDAPVFAAKTHFQTWPSNLILPDSVTLQTRTYTPEQRVQFYNYDLRGNLLEQSKTLGAHEAYQWGYNNVYPVAQATNSKSNDIFYDGFEEGNGNSTLNDGKTGHYSHLSIYTKAITGLDAGSYTLTYWQKVSGTWSFVKTPVTVSGGTYTINLNAQIDDVRFYPSDAQMTTYTYDPLVGMTSSTDSKGETTYYEYDSFQRLMNVKDKDGNILKH
ncbi:hypothetical protein, partial [Mucilaginibacter sp. SG564]|uniref:hypothetical protein n=1 Tax=Mucilaginibacter sp. SG564 TaxID=2587022 RepID=UPI001553D85F